MSRPVPGKGEQSDGGQGRAALVVGSLVCWAPWPLWVREGGGGGAGQGNERKEAVRARVPTSSRPPTAGPPPQAPQHTPRRGHSSPGTAPLPAPTSLSLGLPRFPQMPGLWAGLAAGLGPELKPSEAGMQSLGRKVRVQTHDR